MRCFLGIPVNASVQELALQKSEQLKHLGFRGGWTRRENMHITLFFFGDVTLAKAEKMMATYRETLRDFDGFSMVAEKVDAFSKQGVPKVLYLGFSRCELFQRLYRLGRKDFTHYSYTFPPKNVPHLTLCRVKNKPESDESGLPIWIEPRESTMVDTVSLIHSTLTPQGPIYQELDRIHLQVKGG